MPFDMAKRDDAGSGPSAESLSVLVGDLPLAMLMLSAAKFSLPEIRNLPSVLVGMAAMSFISIEISSPRFGSFMAH